MTRQLTAAGMARQLLGISLLLIVLAVKQTAAQGESFFYL
jgi:hypothetical protein